MTDEFYTGDWEGHYVYGRTTYKRLGGKLVDFKVKLTVKDGVLSGQATEEVTEKYMGAPAVVSGFIEGGMISMIKQYPFRYTSNEEGEIMIDRSRPHVPIHYTGYFDPQSNSFSGEWEIQKVIDQETLYISKGTWEMRKKGRIYE